MMGYVVSINDSNTRHRNTTESRETNNNEMRNCGDEDWGCLTTYIS